ncbi:Fe-S cluster assembly transcriptional regulator IscR [Testudinibacter sp. TR-2022]|uniref:Fe-S cluster assembly transcriptional regulator IscR n=1 Tax=Testudinibacter sp. TR-2022 TaxID=2585029 RepID=UPI001118E921|nr:Fe-S cluster assembly transcriptional regulator IscR [Testudinibacter sp. TR-2022]TNH03683.1 Fe-S cluster assembly transcriptional regulator IscR [Pasteurellaceae bacterium Phil31]TNH08057.1 Fe-S cluster assembly transcriptional regulator IscR [Testudinibacter sp. TR-2022]TNH10269.1 Fe-S cluster assembly transcriptional regulator IscR [Testudinibacter sp. TR-2022]TNH12152.1 Fe-S cluster assembly transcriptional regulator IscR [Testudinibacter sp. TR-2022]TNH16101.1 Fe-S cluster assembly tra
MKLTSKGRYAVTAMLDIALHSQRGEIEMPITLAEISDRQQISLSYLEQLFAKLRRYGLVKSVRGPGGGYLLGMPIDKIAIGMIIAAVNENITATKCKGKGNCQGGITCLTHSLWEQLSEEIEDFLNGITIADLVNKQNQRSALKKHLDQQPFQVVSRT